MEIILAEKDYFREIAEIYVSNWKNTYKGLVSDDYLDKINVEDKIQYWMNYIQQADHYVYVYKDYSDEICGFIALQNDKELDNCLYVGSLHVSNKHRRKGIGTELLNFAKEFCLKNSYKKMSICIVVGNDSAANLYKESGAKHFKFFTHNFDGSIGKSEKLIWDGVL